MKYFSQNKIECNELFKTISLKLIPQKLLNWCLFYSIKLQKYEFSFTDKQRISISEGTNV